jgi:hypothetical protein
VRKKRRLELHIERREISVFARPRQVTDLSSAEGADAMQMSQTACPTCGSKDLILLTEAVTQKHLDFALLNQGMQEGSIHYHRSNSDEWWICTKSQSQT